MLDLSFLAARRAPFEHFNEGCAQHTLIAIKQVAKGSRQRGSKSLPWLCLLGLICFRRLAVLVAVDVVLIAVRYQAHRLQHLPFPSPWTA